MAPHSYGCISRGIGPALNCLFVLRERRCGEQKQRSSERTVRELLPLEQLRWDTVRRVPLKSRPSGPCRPLPGRCAPSAWPNRPTGSAATTSTSAIPRGLWVTRPLTHRVCSRGQIGGKWGTAFREFVLQCERGYLAWQCDVWQWQMCTSRTVQGETDGNGSVSVSKWWRVVDAVFVLKGLGLQFKPFWCSIGGNSDLETPGVGLKG